MDNPLGVDTVYVNGYSPTLLCRIERMIGRVDLGLTQQSAQLPFTGVDLWNAFELTWLAENGLPQVAILSLSIPCTSPYLVESKSLKLYLGSLKQVRFKSTDVLRDTLHKDISDIVGSDIELSINSIDCRKTVTSMAASFRPIGFESAVLLEDTVLEAPITHYELAPHLLATAINTNTATNTITNTAKKEEVGVYCTHLFQSNCPVTNQPDWASLFIKISHFGLNKAALLGYLVSYRCHSDFHENCIERIFKDLLYYLKPKYLTVYGRFNRRGGIDINPFRSNFETRPVNSRLVRQ